MVVKEVVGLLVSGLRCLSGAAGCEGAAQGEAAPWSKEWGPEVRWLGLQQGLARARSSNKPLLLIVARPDCPRCKLLKHQVARSPDFLFLSRFFVMVVEEAAALPGELGLAPDGDYTPRVLFLDPRGAVLDQLVNRLAHPAMKYLYKNHWNLISTMEDAKFVLLKDA